MSWRGVRPERVRRDESRLYVADFPCGGISPAARNHTARDRPRRGRYTRVGLRHKRLFEAIFDVCVRTAGSAALHPRLLIAGPLRGRPCDGMPVCVMARLMAPLRILACPVFPHPHAPCALYGKPLKRTCGLRRFLALERRRGGMFGPIHPMVSPIHPMDLRFHPLDFSFHGHFRSENWPQIVPYSGKNGAFGLPCGGASRGCASLSGGSDFCSFASVGRCARK